MPGLFYKIDRQHGVVHILGPEATSPAEFEAVLEEVVADPEFDQTFGFIRDRSGLAAPPTEWIRRAVEIVAQFPELRRSRWAIVVTSAANYGMYRMAQMLADATTIEVSVFRRLDEAEQWLQETCNKDSVS
jgi:hypothetical protein